MVFDFFAHCLLLCYYSEDEAKQVWANLAEAAGGEVNKKSHWNKLVKKFD
jgi:hypothetical protein